MDVCETLGEDVRRHGVRGGVLQMDMRLVAYLLDPRDTDTMRALQVTHRWVPAGFNTLDHGLAVRVHMQRDMKRIVRVPPT